MEEIGWRGYAIECLQRNYSALKSSLILGVVWALWHIPLYFIPGLLIEEKGLFTLWFWIASLSIIPQTILITWIYNNNENSVFGAILFHFLMNLLGESFFLDGLVKIIRELMWLVFTIIVIIIYGPESLLKNDALLLDEKSFV
jgi:membrane protease YdiL (CAAX protease family)